MATFPIANGVNYTCHPDHRNDNPNKSQWTIAEAAESQVFASSYRSNWSQGRCYWGFHRPDGWVEYCGIAQNRADRLFLAKFVDTNSTGLWHGYPADQRTERPGCLMIRMWLDSAVLPAPKLRKILKGQPCSL